MSSARWVEPGGALCFRSKEVIGCRDRLDSSRSPRMSGFSLRKLFLFTRIYRRRGVLPGIGIAILSILATAAASAQSAPGDAKTKWRELNRAVVAAEASTDYPAALSKATGLLRRTAENRSICRRPAGEALMADPCFTLRIAKVSAVKSI